MCKNISEQPSGRREAENRAGRHFPTRLDDPCKSRGSFGQEARLIRTKATVLPDKKETRTDPQRKRPHGACLYRKIRAQPEAASCLLRIRASNRVDKLEAKSFLSIHERIKQKAIRYKNQQNKPSLPHSAYFLLFPNVFWLRFFRPAVPSYTNTGRKTRQSHTLAGYSPTFSTFASDT